MLDDLTLREVFHIRMSWLGAVSVITLSLIALIVLLSVLIVYTPIRNILPGYSESIRQQLIIESARVDSLQTSLTVQRQYLDMIKQLAAGDIHSDSVQSLDSLERVERAQLVAQPNEATEAFKAQYEEKERDRLLLFDNPSAQSVQQFYRPARGGVLLSARPDIRQYTTFIRTAPNENVMAIMRGTVVLMQRAEDNTFTAVLQHNPYTVIYRRLDKVLRVAGAQVEAGEAIGLMNGGKELELEIWNDGQFVNPEEVIVW